MSIAAMNWVWRLRLRPSVKFVLLALADAADDNGACWPSIPTLANKTCLDDRSVQRILRWLEDGSYLQIARRYREDGAPTSNRYCLALERSGDNLPSTGVADVTQTTTEPELNHQLQPPRGGGLVFPVLLCAGEVTAARQVLDGVDAHICQQLLDELDGRMQKKSIRGSAISYLRTLVARAKSGAFVPEVGIRIAEARKRALNSSAQTTSLATTNKKAAAEHINKLRQTLDWKGI